MAKVRLNLTVDADVKDRARLQLGRVPERSLSELVETWLDNFSQTGAINHEVTQVWVLRHSVLNESNDGRGVSRWDFALFDSQDLAWQRVKQVVKGQENVGYEYDRDHHGLRAWFSRGSLTHVFEVHAMGVVNEMTSY